MVDTVLDLSELTFPVILKPREPLSDEQLMQFSEQNRPYRVERNKEGELTIMTPVGGVGSTNEFYVSSQLAWWVDRVGGGIGFSPNGGFLLPDGTTLSPDAAWIPLASWKKLTSAQRKGFPPLCPEFVIEVRSESDPRRMVEAKMQTWIQNGAKLAWLVDPQEKTVTIYSAGSEPETLDQPEVVMAGEPVGGFSLSCNRLWASEE